MNKENIINVNFSQYMNILSAEKVDIHILLSYFKKTDMDYDANGNILINFNEKTKGTPILVAHTDNVLHGERIPVMDLTGSNIIGKKAGIGFDDKAGIIGIIEIWRRSKTKDFRIIFTADEEVGGVGAIALDKRVYEDAAYIIELDRRGGKDLINVSGTTRLCSNEFADMFTCYGFKKETGTFTDVNIFKECTPKINMVNLSIGYYNPHTDNEYLCIKEFNYIVACVADFVETHKEYIPDNTPVTKPKYNYETNRYGSYGRYGSRAYNDDALICDWCGRSIIREEEAFLYDDEIFCCRKCWEEAYKYDRKNDYDIDEVDYDEIEENK